MLSRVLVVGGYYKFGFFFDSFIGDWLLSVEGWKE